ncbi:hypothetical protein CLNEO_13580 [Anaerotignum neopropionicum]|uniref:Uncharacterized protein n=1 Tax=Anaerotignum neopropionicum TaxID=36847 RepID=A0A136WFY8_9FIRM|nr:hypothetical protein [Anaerotignum neopropionicum]KXL53387.1 hypothetical protein CLNEO_13580 [Anaerotignum neopropionicum]
MNTPTTATPTFIVRKEKVEDFLSGTTKGNLQKVLARADKFKKKEGDNN